MCVYRQVTSIPRAYLVVLQGLLACLGTFWLTTVQAKYVRLETESGQDAVDLGSLRKPIYPGTP